MDLSTMENKLNKNAYKNKKEFLDDLYLIFDNCMKFNGSATTYYK